MELPENFKKVLVPASTDDLELSVLIATPKDLANKPAKGIVQLVHGMCEYKERYIPFMKYLNEQGYLCLIHDHRGHGETEKSMDTLGYFHKGGWKAMVEDVHVVTEFAKKEWPNLPIVLLGHSMGSMVVRIYTKRYDNLLSGLVVCGSPSKNSAIIFGAFLTSLSKLFAGEFSRPKFLQKLSFGVFDKRFKEEGRTNAWVCSDSDVVDAYNKDPYCNFCFTANGFENLFKLMKETYSKKNWQMKNPDLPIFFISGADDPCLRNEKHGMKSVAFMQKLGYHHVGYHFYSGLRHEILNEKRKEQVWKDVFEFCDKAFRHL